MKVDSVAEMEADPSPEFELLLLPPPHLPPSTVRGFFACKELLLPIERPRTPAHEKVSRNVLDARNLLEDQPRSKVQII